MWMHHTVAPKCLVFMKAKSFQQCTTLLLILTVLTLFIKETMSTNPTKIHIQYILHFCWQCEHHLFILLYFACFDLNMIMEKLILAWTSSDHHETICCLKSLLSFSENDTKHFSPDHCNLNRVGPNHSTSCK